MRFEDIDIIIDNSNANSHGIHLYDVGGQERHGVLIKNVSILCLDCYYGIDVEEYSDVSIEDVVINGTSDGWAGLNIGDATSSTSNFSLQNIYVYGFFAAGMYVAQAENITVRNFIMEEGMNQPLFGIWGSVGNVDTSEWYIYDSLLNGSWTALGAHDGMRNTVIGTRLYADEAYDDSSSIIGGVGVRIHTIIDSVANGTWKTDDVASTGTYLYNWTFINVSSEPDDVVTDADCNNNATHLCYFEFVNYLDVVVNDSNGDPVVGALVNITDKDGNVVNVSYTGAGGVIERLNITYAVVDHPSGSRTNTFYSLHTVNVSNASYSSGSQVNLSSGQIVYLTLSDSEDTDPPVISAVGSNDVDNSSASINWTTDEAANGTVNYGTTIGLGTKAYDTDLLTNRNISLTSLVNNTFYYYNVTSCDSGGYCTEEGNYNFTTAQNVDVTAPIITLDKPSDSSGDIDGTISFNFTLTDESAVSNCTFTFDSALNQSNLSVDKEVTQTFTLTNVAAGDHTWSVNCTDSGGYERNSSTRTVHVVSADNWVGNISDLSGVDVNSVSSFYVRNEYGNITWTASVDLTGGPDINSYVYLQSGLGGVDSKQLSALNTTADIALFSLSYVETPIVYKNGVLCGSACNILSYASNNLIFNVTSFSNYTVGNNSRLDINDTSDSQSVYEGTQHYFYANYSNTTSQEPINGTDIYCEFQENSAGSWSAAVNMTFNTTTSLYEYNRTFGSAGTYDFNVSCDGTVQNFEDLLGSDEFTVTLIATVSITSPSNGTNVDRDSVSADADSVFILAQLSSAVNNTNVTFWANLTDPVITGQTNISLGKVLTNESGIASLAWSGLDNESNTMYAGNYTIWAESDTYSLGSTAFLHLMGGLNLTFRFTDDTPNSSYSQGQTVVLDELLLGYGPETDAMINGTYLAQVNTTLTDPNKGTHVVELVDPDIFPTKKKAEESPIELTKPTPEQDSAPVNVLPTPEAQPPAPTLSTDSSMKKDEKAIKKLSENFDVEIQDVRKKGWLFPKRQIHVSEGSNEMLLDGVKSYKGITAIEFTSTGMATDVAVVNNADIEGAVIRLAKHRNVQGILRCDDFNIEDNTCSKWVKTDIPFTDHGSYIEFEVEHFTGYSGEDSGISNGPSHTVECLGDSCVATYFPEQVNYYNGSEYVPINTTVENKSLTISNRDYDYGVDKGIYEAYFRDLSSDVSTRPVAMRKNGYVFTLAPQGFILFEPHKGTTQGRVGNKVQSNVVLSDNSATYPDQYDNVGTAGAFANLTFTYQNSQLKEELVIWDKDYLQSRFDSQVDADDYNVTNLVFQTVIRAYKDNDTDNMTLGVFYGSGKTKFKEFGLAANDEQTFTEEIYFTDENNNTVYYIPELYAWDNNGSRILLNKTLSMNAFGNLRVDVLVPFSWLNASDRLYPVIIDPSTSVNYTYTSSWVAPGGVYEVQVELWGAGGAGGGSNSNYDGGGGGAGGQFVRKNITVVPGTNYTITVGSGGTGAANSNGNPGGDTWFNHTGTVIAKGGAGGQSFLNGAGGGAGSTSGGFGTVVYPGGNGGDGIADTSSGGGGGGAGTTGAGGNASGVTQGSGTANWGGAGGVGTTARDGAGGAGSNYGGGSGGSTKSSVPNSGGDGLVNLTYTVNSPPTVTTDMAADASVDEGQDINFTITASDPDNDNYMLTVCNETGITDGYPGTCDGANLCNSSITTDDFEASCVYTTGGGDVGSFNAYGYVCDAGSSSCVGPNQTTTTVNDITAPAITVVKNRSVTVNSVNITWTTDENSNCSVNYGTTASLGDIVKKGDSVTAHAINFSGLSGDQIYFYNVTSCDSSDNCNTTGTYNFTTGSYGNLNVSISLPVA
ncbi:glycine-rich domain-containing protein [Nanoarchaeota archaeon]